VRSRECERHLELALARFDSLAVLTMRRLAKRISEADLKTI
jgi:hypothetical protein